MKKYLILLSIAVFTILFCTNCDLTNEGDPVENMKDLNPPPDFEFNTTRNVEISLISYTQFGDLVRPHANFELWKGDPTGNNGKNILKARTDLQGNFTTAISLPTYLDEIYLKSYDLIKPLEIVPDGKTSAFINDSFVYNTTSSQRGNRDFTPDSDSDNGYIFTLENMDCGNSDLTQIDLRVQNDNDKGLSHIAISLPDGEIPPEPEDGDTYTGEQKSYHVENPTNNPYYSIKFETLDEDGIKNGQSDLFVYFLPTDVAEAMEEITVRAKAANIIGEVTLDVIFDCGVADTDGDGVPDDEDAYPEDPTRAYNSYTPSEEEYSTIMYEDLWPSTGDYDMNDMVINYQMIAVMDPDYQIVGGIINFILRASGAGYDLGFAIEFPDYYEFSNLDDDLDLANLEDNGRTIVFFQNQRVSELFDAPSDDWINTDPDDPTYYTPVEWTITVDISEAKNSRTVPPWYTPLFNPFIFINGDRTHEIHLLDYPPTAQMNTPLFDTDDDDSDPSQGLYFRTDNNLPWAINIAESIDYPDERVQILDAFHHFAEWVNSGGSEYSNWYQDEPGYRNNSLIYAPPE